MTRGVIPLLDTPLPRSRPATLGVTPCSPSVPASSTLPWETHPSRCLGLVLTGGRDREHGCMLGTPGGLGERSSRLSLPQGEPPPIACMGQRFCFKMSPFSRDFHRDCFGLEAAQVLVYSRGGQSAISSLGMIFFFLNGTLSRQILPQAHQDPSLPDEKTNINLPTPF